MHIFQIQKSTIKALIFFYSTPGMTYSKLIQTLPAPAEVNLTPKTTNRNREARAGQYTWWSIVAESLKMKNQTVPLYIPRQVKENPETRTVTSHSQPNGTCLQKRAETEGDTRRISKETTKLFIVVRTLWNNKN